MPLYFYKAIDKAGKLHKGSLTADSSTQAYQIAKDQNLTLIRIHQNRRQLFKRPFSFYNLADSFLHLEHFVKSQISLAESIKILIMSSRDRNISKVWKEVLFLLESGLQFYQALERFPHIFPMPVVYLMMVGEKSGNLAQSFSNVQKWLQRKHNQRHQLYNTLRYPLFLSLAVILLTVLMVYGVVPEIQNLFATMGIKNQSLATNLLISFVQTLQNLPWIKILVTLAIIFSIMLLTKRLRSLRYHLILYVPFYGLVYRYYQIASWLYTVGFLLQNKVDLITSIDVANHSLGNFYMQNKLNLIPLQIKAGKNFTECLSGSNLFPSFILGLLEIGERLANLDNISLKAAQLAEKIAENKMQKILAWTGPLLLITIGLMIVWIVAAVILPIYDHLAVLQ